MSLDEKITHEIVLEGHCIDETEEPILIAEDVKQFIKELKDCKRFKQSGKELGDELGINDAQKIQQIQLMFTEILLEINQRAGKGLI